MPNDSIFLTPEAFETLRSELEHLTTEGRAEMEARIAEARSHGDIRENADYDSAKNEQGLMEARIRNLEHVLHVAEVHEVEVSDTVIVGSLVTVLDEDGDDLVFFVAPAENRQPGVLLASPSSPLGAALMGAKLGDKVSYEAPGGTFALTVKGIEPFRG